MNATRRSAQAFLVIALVSALEVVAAPPTSDSRTCRGIPVRILGSEAADADSICEGARDAFSFFQSQGFHVQPVRVEVRESLPLDISPSAAGGFWERESRVLLLPYSVVLQNKSWFNVPIDRRIYRSLAAHEVTHALAVRNFAVANPTIPAREYVAYVVMFVTMDAILRAQILRGAAGPGFESADRFTELLHAFDPMRFGVEAYRYHVRPQNGRSFLDAVLRGNALAE